MIDFIIENAADLVEIAAYVVAAASVIASMTPSEKDNKVICAIKKVVDVLALNVGKAKPKD